jgi:hypothetical protein
VKTYEEVCKYEVTITGPGLLDGTGFKPWWGRGVP